MLVRKTLWMHLILFLWLIGFSALSKAEAPVVFSCAAELDAAVILASNPDTDFQQLNARFANLEKQCPDDGQFAHNQGVLAAKQAQWPKAIAHFQRSLALDKRAADTHRHLQQIFETRAAAAYARALGTELEAEQPDLRFQDSGLHNPQNLFDIKPLDTLRHVPTIEYELYAWWQARKHWKDVRSHYVEGYDVEAIKIARSENQQRSWDDTFREIAFTNDDVVVVLSDSSRGHTLLLMRLVGSRWRIYQETRL